VGKSLTAVTGRGGNGLLLRTNSERIRRTGWQLHALRVEARRQVARSGRSVGVVGTQCWCGRDVVRAQSGRNVGVGNTTAQVAAVVPTGAGTVWIVNRLVL
jgi:hypothetical protein